MSRLHNLCITGLCLALPLLLNSCAERQDALETELQLIGVWSDVYDDVADISVGENALYVLSNNRRGILTFDLNMESAPVPVGGAPDLGSLYDPNDDTFISSYLVDDHLLFAKLATNLLVFDVSDPLAPVYIRTFFASGVNNEFVLTEAVSSIEDDVVVERDYYYMYYSDRSDGLLCHKWLTDPVEAPASSPGLWFYTGANPTSEYFSTLRTDEYENDGNDLVVVDDIIYLANGEYGLKIFRIAGSRMPMNLEEIATLRLPGDAIRLDVDGDLAAIALGGDGLAIVDVSDPSRPYLRSLHEPGGTTLDVELSEQHAFLANSSKGTLVLDLTDPAHPSQRWQYVSHYAQRIRLAHGRIYVADRNDGLLILNNPLN